MKARCQNCNNHLDFRTQRGNRLSDYKCKCGGTFERLNNHLLDVYINKDKKFYKLESYIWIEVEKP